MFAFALLTVQAGLLMPRLLILRSLVLLVPAVLVLLDLFLKAPRVLEES